jgi:hypothetical protein
VLRHDDRVDAPPLAIQGAPGVRRPFRGELTEVDWQRWIDQLTRQGLSRWSIAQLISLASGIYAWAAAPSRRSSTAIHSVSSSSRPTTRSHAWASR